MPRIIGKLPNHSKNAPGGLWKRGRKRVFFLENEIFFSSKNRKNIKEMEINIFLLKKYELVPKLSYIFFKKILSLILLPQKY